MIFRFSAMGDVAMLLPVLRCLYQQNPGIQVTLVTRKHLNPIFKEFLELQIINPDFESGHKGFKGLYQLYKELKALKPRRIADVHNVLRTAVLRFFFASQPFVRTKKLDKGRQEKRALTRPKRKTLKPLTPQLYRYVEVFAKLGYTLDLDKHEFPPKPILPSMIDSDPNQKWIGIAPFAAHKGKVYPLDLMQKVIGYLQQQHSVFLFGHGPDEEAQMQIWTRAYPNVHRIGMSFSDELDLIANLDLMISMDSANGHLAANHGVPVLTLWGMTHPFLGFAPFRQDNNLIVDRAQFPKTPTSTYGNKLPKGYEKAMRSISPESVIEKAQETLGS
ncbi:MAG: glycosyltransferase family 9 protein [Flavobacteriaceae bacterium]